MVMAINFCHPIFQPHIVTSAVTTDGYGVDNLCRSNDNIFQVRGFMAEYFIKPPIDITFEFPCNIQLDQIVIDPNLGAQKSCGFEVFTKSIAMHSRDRWLLGMKSDSKKQCTTKNRGMVAADVANPVGKVFFKDTGIRQVCFVNRQFRPRAPYQSSPKSGEQPGIVVRELRHHWSQTLANVSHLVLRISRVFSGCVPSLGKVEIYGQPAGLCGQEVESDIILLLQTLHTKSKSRQKCVSSNEGESSAEDRSSKQPFSTDLSSDVSPEFPVDFVDPITCEMMSLPVLLPSGHTIDQSTLDKHIATEANWGRKANDPFTGLQFTENSKPVPNVKLKARIDQFLLTAGRELEMVPRTVGRASDLHNLGVHGMRNMNTMSTETSSSNSVTEGKSSKVTPQDNYQHTQISRGQLAKQSSHSQNVHRESSRNRDKSRSNKFQNTHTAHSAVEPCTWNIQQTPPVQSKPSFKSVKRNVDTADAVEGTGENRHLTSKKPKSDGFSLSDVVPMASASSSGKEDDHEKKLALSLDNALESTLGKMRSFRRTDQGSGSTPAAERSHCSSCSLSFSSISHDSPMYIMPCGHFLCRQCLFDLKGVRRSTADLITCCLCQRSYSSNQVTRTHLSN